MCISTSVQALHSQMLVEINQNHHKTLEIPLNSINFNEI